MGDGERRATEVGGHWCASHFVCRSGRVNANNGSLGSLPRVWVDQRHSGRLRHDARGKKRDGGVEYEHVELTDELPKVL